MKKSVMTLIMLLVAVMLAAACGGGNAGNSGNTGSAGNGSAAQESAGNTAAEEGGAAAVSAPAEETTLTITHELGTTTVKKNPAKVVVFDFGVLDSLDKLGVEVAAVPQANIPPYLAKYEDKKYVNAGSLKEPDFEAINELAPDLILISGRQSSFYKELSEIAPTVFMGVDTSRYMESFKDNATKLGQIFGKEAEAAAELAAIDTTIASVKTHMADSGRNGLIVLSTGGKISAYGPGSRFGLIHDVLGVPAADPGIEVSTHGASVSFEYIAEKNPDYLFVIDRDSVVSEGETGAAVKVIENDLVKNTKAFKDGHIVYLDPNYWYLSGGGLVSVSEMVKEVEAGVTG